MTNTALRDKIKETILAFSRADPPIVSLDETADQILALIQDNQEPLQVNPKSHTYLPNQQEDKTL